MATKAIDLMMDSGAFSAWRKGKQVDLAAYASFLYELKDDLACYVNLDVIPSRPGSTPTTAEVDDSAKASWKNYQWMRKQGLDPIPVFHCGERFYWLEKMLGEGADYIGLGGIASSHSAQRRRWLDQTFSFLCGDRGWPPVKVHGFGVSSPVMLFKYPWYSMDSTSWRKNPIYGVVWVPRLNSAGVYDYDKSPRIIMINSRKKKSIFGTHDTHYAKMGKQTADHVEKYFTALGFDFQVDRDNDLERRRMMIRYFKAVQAHHSLAPWIIENRVSGFFSGSKASTTSMVAPTQPRIFFGIGTLDEDLVMLGQEKISDRLVSYLECVKLDTRVLRRFIRTGLVEMAREKV